MRQAITGVLIPFLLTGISHGQTSCDADLNGDLVVNLEDLLGMLVHYGDSCAITQIIHPTLVVSEIHYNPNSLQGNDSDWEFLELFNPNENVVPLHGWMLSDAVSHSFTEMDSIGAFSFFVVARNADTLSTVVAQEIGLAEWDSGGGSITQGKQSHCLTQMKRPWFQYPMKTTMDGSKHLMEKVPLWSLWTSIYRMQKSLRGQLHLSLAEPQECQIPCGVCQIMNESGR